MIKDDDRHARELTDAQLDQILATANKGLLYHIEAAADPDDAIRAIIDRANQESLLLDLDQIDLKGNKSNKSSQISMPADRSRPGEFARAPDRSSHHTDNPHDRSAAGDPTVLKILLGTRLHRLRETACITREQAGFHIRASSAKIARLELGRLYFKERDVSDLLDLYQVDPATRQELAQLTAEANAIPWWHEYRDGVPDWFHTYLGLETAAALIRTYEVQFVPSLLETEEYARAVIVQGSPHLTPQEVDSRVAVRMGRQKLFAREDRQRLWAIVDEAALRRQMGGREVLAGQLRRLIATVSEPNIILQVMPFTFGGHAALGGPFTILRFPEADLPDMVYVEYLTGAHYLDRPEEVEVYAAAMEQLSATGTSPERTRDILSSILKEI